MAQLTKIHVSGQSEPPYTPGLSCRSQLMGVGANLSDAEGTHKGDGGAQLP